MCLAHSICSWVSPLGDDANPTLSTKDAPFVGVFLLERILKQTAKTPKKAKRDSGVAKEKNLPKIAGGQFDKTLQFIID